MNEDDDRLLHNKQSSHQEEYVIHLPDEQNWYDVYNYEKNAVTTHHIIPSYVMARHLETFPQLYLYI